MTKGQSLWHEEKVEEWQVEDRRNTSRVYKTHRLTKKKEKKKI